MEKKMERRGLGRGLSALMADINVAPVQSGEASLTTARKPEVLPIERLQPNPNQPRRHFTAENLEELSKSLMQKGILQPLIVRPIANSQQYEIVAGERRWRAAQMAQLHEVPVLIREFDDTEVLEVGIIENIQRADLNAIEEALAYRQLMDRFGHTQEKLAEALSKSRSHIANLLRLLNLPEDVRDLVRDGKLSAGHARALITAPNPSDIAKQVVARALTVRETEDLMRKPSSGTSGNGGAGRSRSAGGEKDADTRALEMDLSANLKMNVTIHHEPGGERGVLSVRYTSLDDLDLLCRVLSLTPRDGSI